MEPHKIVLIIVSMIMIVWFAFYMTKEDAKYRQMHPSLWDEIQSIKASLEEIKESLRER